MDHQKPSPILTVDEHVEYRMNPLPYLMPPHAVRDAKWRPCRAFATARGGAMCEITPRARTRADTLEVGRKGGSVMMRVVALEKAIIAGAAGALAWDAAIRAAIFAGAPLFDLTKLLGSMLTGAAPAWEWWPAGFVLHAMVGVIWAIFYAYFFFYTWDVRPAVQGLIFSLAPLTLAGLVMLPQMALMHPLILAGRMPDPGIFAARLGWGGPFALAAGHALYGAVMGALYTRPVGHPVPRARAHA